MSPEASWKPGAVRHSAGHCAKSLLSMPGGSRAVPSPPLDLNIARRDFSSGGWGYDPEAVELKEKDRRLGPSPPEGDILIVGVFRTGDWSITPNISFSDSVPDRAETPSDDKAFRPDFASDVGEMGAVTTVSRGSSSDLGAKGRALLTFCNREGDSGSGRGESCRSGGQAGSSSWHECRKQGSLFLCLFRRRNGDRCRDEDDRDAWSLSLGTR
jgi:hypothetical protein